MKMNNVEHCRAETLAGLMNSLQKFNDKLILNKNDLDNFKPLSYNFDMEISNFIKVARNLQNDIRLQDEKEYAFMTRSRLLHVNGDNCYNENLPPVFSNNNDNSLYKDYLNDVIDHCFNDQQDQNEECITRTIKHRNELDNNEKDKKSKLQHKIFHQNNCNVNEDKKNVSIEDEEENSLNDNEHEVNVMWKPIVDHKYRKQNNENEMESNNIEINVGNLKETEMLNENLDKKSEYSINDDSRTFDLSSIESEFEEKRNCISMQSVKPITRITGKSQKFEKKTPTKIPIFNRRFLLPTEHRSMLQDSLKEHTSSLVELQYSDDQSQSPIEHTRNSDISDIIIEKSPVLSIINELESIEENKLKTYGSEMKISDDTNLKKVKTWYDIFNENTKSSKDGKILKYIGNEFEKNLFVNNSNTKFLNDLDIIYETGIIKKLSEDASKLERKLKIQRLPILCVRGKPKIQKIYQISIEATNNEDDGVLSENLDNVKCLNIVYDPFKKYQKEKEINISNIKEIVDYSEHQKKCDAVCQTTTTANLDNEKQEVHKENNSRTQCHQGGNKYLIPFLKDITVHQENPFDPADSNEKTSNTNSSTNFDSNFSSHLENDSFILKLNESEYSTQTDDEKIRVTNNKESFKINEKGKENKQLEKDDDYEKLSIEENKSSNSTDEPLKLTNLMAEILSMSERNVEIETDENFEEKFKLINDVINDQSLHSGDVSLTKTKETEETHDIRIENKNITEKNFEFDKTINIDGLIAAAVTNTKVKNIENLNENESFLSSSSSTSKLSSSRSRNLFKKLLKKIRDDELENVHAYKSSYASRLNRMNSNIADAERTRESQTKIQQNDLIINNEVEQISDDVTGINKYDGKVDIMKSNIPAEFGIKQTEEVLNPKERPKIDDLQRTCINEIDITATPPITTIPTTTISNYDMNKVTNITATKRDNNSETIKVNKSNKMNVLNQKINSNKIISLQSDNNEIKSDPLKYQIKYGNNTTTNDSNRNVMPLILKISSQSSSSSSFPDENHSTTTNKSIEEYIEKNLLKQHKDIKYQQNELFSTTTKIPRMQNIENLNLIDKYDCQNEEEKQKIEKNQSYQFDQIYQTNHKSDYDNRDNQSYHDIDKSVNSIINHEQMIKQQKEFALKNNPKFTKIINKICSNRSQASSSTSKQSSNFGYVASISSTPSSLLFKRPSSKSNDPRVHYAVKNFLKSMENTSSTHKKCSNENEKFIKKIESRADLRNLESNTKASPPLENFKSKNELSSVISNNSLTLTNAHSSSLSSSSSSVFKNNNHITIVSNVNEGKYGRNDKRNFLQNSSLNFQNNDTVFNSDADDIDLDDDNKEDSSSGSVSSISILKSLKSSLNSSSLSPPPPPPLHVVNKNISRQISQVPRHHMNLVITTNEIAKIKNQYENDKEEFNNNNLSDGEQLSFGEIQ